MWGIMLDCKPHCGAHVSSAARTSDHNMNSVANALKDLKFKRSLSLKNIYDNV